MNSLALILLVIIVTAATLFALDRLALWMERRGWIYWRRHGPGGGAVAGVFTEMQKIVEPQVKHVIEHRDERNAAERDESGPARLKR